MRRSSRPNQSTGGSEVESVTMAVFSRVRTSLTAASPRRWRPVPGWSFGTHEQRIQRLPTVVQADLAAGTDLGDGRVQLFGLDPPAVQRRQHGDQLDVLLDEPLHDLTEDLHEVVAGGHQAVVDEADDL